MLKALNQGLMLIAGLAMLHCAGCMTRTLQPSLPYVQPAHTVPEQDQGRVHLAARVEEFEAELQRLRGSVEQLQARGANDKIIEGLKERVAFIEKHLGVEPPPPGPPPASPRSAPGFQPQMGRIDPEPPAERRPPSQRTGPPTAVDQASPQEITGDDNPTDDEKAFRDAYMAYRKGDLKEALPLFEGFVKNYPKSALASDAVYWLGETLFGLGRYDEAVLSFDRVVKDFPGSKKELAALLRQGECFEKMGDVKSARIIYEKLMKEHPHATQARAAKSRLAEQQKERSRP